MSVQGPYPLPAQPGQEELVRAKGRKYKEESMMTPRERVLGTCQFWELLGCEVLPNQPGETSSSSSVLCILNQIIYIKSNTRQVLFLKKARAKGSNEGKE